MAGRSSTDRLARGSPAPPRRLPWLVRLLLLMYPVLVKVRYGEMG